MSQLHEIFRARYLQQTSPRRAFGDATKKLVSCRRSDGLRKTATSTARLPAMATAVSDDIATTAIVPAAISSLQTTKPGNAIRYNRLVIKGRIAAAPSE